VNVRLSRHSLPNTNQTHLRLGTEFQWKTFGVTIDSTVLHEGLAWDEHCNGVHAYHAVEVSAAPANSNSPADAGLL
jgi:hypothetical protein